MGCHGINSIAIIVAFYNGINSINNGINSIATISVAPPELFKRN